MQHMYINPKRWSPEGFSLGDRRIVLAGAPR